MAQQYATDAASLNNVLASLSKNTQFSQLNGFNAPQASFFTSLGTDGGVKDNQMFSNIRDGLNSSIGSVIPNAQVPIFGQTFSSPAQVEQWAQQNGYTGELNNLK